MKHLKLFEEMPADSSAKPLTDKDLLGETGFISNYLSRFKTPAEFLKLLGIPLSKTTGIQIGDYLKRFTDPRTGVKGAVDSLDGWVTPTNLEYVLSILKSLQGKKMADGKSAVKRFAELYKIDENGDDLLKDVESIGTTTFSTDEVLVKDTLVNFLKQELK